MSKYQIHYIVAASETGATYGSHTEVAEVEGACYGTQSTNGAGLVCDVFSENGSRVSDPDHTFSNVQRVSKVAEEDSGLIVVGFTPAELNALFLWQKQAWADRNGNMEMEYAGGKSLRGDFPLGDAFKLIQEAVRANTPKPSEKGAQVVDKRGDRPRAVFED